MNRDSADLCFNSTHQPVGFTSGVLAQFDGSAEPVVRELLQNSLDAAREAGRSAKVSFVICEVPKASLPGWDKYTSVYQKACQDRHSWNAGKPSHDEKMVVDRIRKAIDSPMIPLMLCIDNGHGLNGKRMDALLTPGNTSKGASGAGSFGLGHHAAFGASNLRYVLYGAQYRNREGQTKRIASGHAILASHREQDPGRQARGRLRRRKPSFSGRRGHADTRLLAADGYWFRVGQAELAFDGTHENYPRTAPNLLTPYLDDLGDTGTVVCIAGFNDFHRDDDDPSVVESICRVAAANFSDAIHSGRLTATVYDERYDIEETEINPAALHDVLKPISKQMRAEKQGQIRGANAFNAVLPLQSGQQIESPDGQVVRWRSLAGNDRAVTQVHVFRRGMWITSRAPGLVKSNFSRAEPFDAVLSLSDGPLEQLVRSAEGPEHRGLDRKRLDNVEKKQLRELIAVVAERLREAVGERTDLQEFIPVGFATLEGQLNRAAETVRRARAPSGGGRRNQPVEGGEKDTGAGSKKQRRKGVPRPGSVPSYRSALRADAGEPVIQVYLRYEEEAAPGSRIGVRVRAASGADASCEQPLPDTFLPMVSVADAIGNHARAAEAGGEVELTLPAAAGERQLTVTLAKPVGDPALLELDLVRRSPQQKNAETKTDCTEADNTTTDKAETDDTAADEAAFDEVAADVKHGLESSQPEEAE